ncbi:MAG: SMEK domain-containing protein [Deltaproteobacteria bacterium]|nr:SMEK domain-containing protein [Deltaproteobacteria bacterium]
MNRTEYYNYIDEKLHILAHRITTGGKLNMLSLHAHSENFYLHFFNLLYGYNLKNLNKYFQNVEAIDLVDNINKIVIQISSTNTKQKIESALKKEIIKKYLNYRFKFISIAKDASDLKKNTFNNPHSISFNPSEDIYDIKSILKKILSDEIDKQKTIYQFIKTELGGEIDIVKLDSNLATIINILSKEDWDKTDIYIDINSFEIERKISFNDLDSARDIIEDYRVHHGKVDAKYSEFDKAGHNKSISVLATVKKEYLRIENSKNADEKFFSVIDAIKNKVLESSNYVSIPIDELELCIDILVVDAFIRCKIFENPKGYNYAAS